MDRKKRGILVAVILVAMVLFVAVPVVAKPQRTYFDAVEYTCGVELGTVWTTGDGKMQHTRGQILYDVVVSDESRMSGSAVVEVNMNMDMLSGMCTAWGKEVYEVEGGSWLMNYSGRCTDFVYAGGGVARGTGDLKGQLLFMEAGQSPPPEDNPCPGGLAFNVFELSGYILEP